MKTDQQISDQLRKYAEEQCGLILQPAARLAPIKASFSMMLVNLLNSYEEASLFLDSWFQDSSIKPQKYDIYEPIKRPVNAEAFDDMVECVSKGLIFKRNKPFLETSVFSRREDDGGNHALVVTDFNGEDTSCDSLQYLLKRISTQLVLDYSSLHQISKHEIEFSARNGSTFIQGSKDLKCHFSVSSGVIQQYIPDIYWANLFGPAYIEHFGRERLLSSPAETVEEWNDGHIFIRLSDDIMDFENDFPRMQSIRERVKEHLGNESFFSQEKGSEGKYSVPDFRLWQRRGLEKAPVIAPDFKPEPNPKNDLRIELVHTLTRWRDYSSQREPLLPTLVLEPDNKINMLPVASHANMIALAKKLISANTECLNYILTYDGKVTADGETTPAFIAEGGLKGNSKADLYAQKYRWTGLLRKTRELIGAPFIVGDCESLFEVGD